MLQHDYIAKLPAVFFLLLRGKILEFITIKQASEKWNISVRRVQVLCRQERIPGAKKFGRDWAIPDDAEKPLDGRITTGEYTNWRKKHHDK